MKKRLPIFLLGGAAAYFSLGRMAAAGRIPAALAGQLLWPLLAALAMGLLIAPVFEPEGELSSLSSAPWGAAVLLMAGTLWQWPRSCPEWVGWLPLLLWCEWAVGLVGQGVLRGTVSLVSRQIVAAGEEQPEEDPEK